MNTRRFSAAPAILVFVLTAVPAMAQTGTSARIIQTVIGVGGDSFLAEGQALTGLGSWVRLGGAYRDPLARGADGGYQFFANASDHDLRLILPQGTTEAEAIRIYQDVRQKVIQRVRAAFGPEADRVLGSMNIYPPEQLMRGVESEAEALRRLDELGIKTPNLGGKAPEGLFTPGRMEYARGYEKSGKLFYNRGGRMAQGSADILSDVVKGAEDTIEATVRGATANAEAFSKKAYGAFLEGKPKDVLKDIERAQVQLQRGQAILQEGGTLAKSQRSGLYALYEDLKKAIIADPALANPATEQKLLQYAKQATLEARLLGRLETASAAEKELILRWLEEMRTGPGLWTRMWNVFDKVPLHEIGKTLEVLFIFYEGYVISGKLGEGDVEGALKEAGVFAAFTAAGLGAGSAVLIADILLEQAKSFGYSLVASTQDCEDLLDGVFTVRGREVNIQDQKIRGLTVDDLVLLYRKASDVEAAVAYRSRLAADRGLGQATGRSDAEVENQLNERCAKTIIEKWSRKRNELDGRLAKLAASFKDDPLVISFSPDPAVFTVPNAPHILRAGVDMPLKGLGDLEKEMGFLLDRLAGKGQYAIQIRYRWTIDGNPAGRDYPTAEFELRNPGPHEIQADVTFNILPGFDYERTFQAVTRTAAAVVDVAFPPEEKKPGEKPKSEAQPETKTKPEPPADKGAASGSGAPSAGGTGGAGAGYFILKDVIDTKNAYTSHADVVPGSSKVEINGNIVVTSAQFQEYVAPGQTRVVDKSTRTTLPDLPKIIARGQKIPISLSVAGAQPPPRVRDLLSWDNRVDLNIWITTRASAGFNAPAVYNGLGTDLFGQISMGKAEVSISVVGVGGSVLRRFIYEYAAGAPPAAALEVTIASDKTAPVPGDRVTLTAAATGGTGPYTFAWSGASTGTGSVLPFDVAKPGRSDFTVIVTDMKGAKTSAAFSLNAGGLSAMVTLRGGPPKVKLGEKRMFDAVVMAGNERAQGTFDFQWQPHPEVQFTPFEGSPTSSALFKRTGRAKVWVQVLQNQEGRKATVAESDQIEIEIVPPNYSLAIQPQNPLVGQEVKLSVKADTAAAIELWSYWWEIAGNALNSGPISGNREYTFIAKDLNPVTVTVHGKAVEDGADLGEAKSTIQAKPYLVTVGEAVRMGPAPRVWSAQAKGLVEVPRSIGTFQDFTVKADISPQPAGATLRYAWTVEPEGCSLVSPAGRETRGNAGRGGTYRLFVTVRDDKNIILGSGETSVSVVEPAPEQKPAGAAAPGNPPSSNKELAAQKNKQAQDLGNQGKLEEAIAAAEEAMKLDPGNALAEAIVRRSRAAQHTDRALKLGKEWRLDEAAAELLEAKKDDPTHPDIAEYEKWIAQLRLDRVAEDKLKQAFELNKQSRFEEGLALSEEALRLVPDNKLAPVYIASFKASIRLVKADEHLQAGRLNEAAAEIAAAKGLYPSHGAIPNYEQRLRDLIARRDAADAAAEAQKAEAARKAAEQRAAEKKLAEQRAAEGKAREEAARAAEEERKRREESSLAGTAWSGEAALSNENISMTLPIVLSVDGENQISGEIDVKFEDESRKIPLRGAYNPETRVIEARFELSSDEGSIRGTLTGTAKNPQTADGQATLTISSPGVDSATVKGTWRIARR